MNYMNIKSFDFYEKLCQNKNKKEVPKWRI